MVVEKYRGQNSDVEVILQANRGSNCTQVTLRLVYQTYTPKLNAYSHAVSCYRIPETVVCLFVLYIAGYIEHPRDQHVPANAHGLSGTKRRHPTQGLLMLVALYSRLPNIYVHSAAVSYTREIKKQICISSHRSHYSQLSLLQLGPSSPRQ
jgi:hypothetical protein